jgi:IS5 family transposase
VSDIIQAHALLHGDETTAFSDAGYLGVERRQENEKSAVARHVALHPGKRRTVPDTKTGRLREQLEKLKASVRAKVEHPFHVVKNIFGHKKARYRGLAKNTTQLHTLFGLANLIIAKRRLFEFQAQGVS